jgi:hypothetical protein
VERLALAVERPAEDDQAVVDEPVHELCVLGPERLRSHVS